ncbi:RNA polymerase factor sigma-70 [Paenibacillus sp. P1XP2]|nr:RNA polymerase factor sigma-70 [Paenibacillus sp. P1XP2]
MTTPLYSTFPHDLEGMLTDVRPELLRYCRSLTGREWEAEDLAQETLIRVLCRHAKMPGIKVNKPYVFRIARNLWIDRCALAAARHPYPSKSWILVPHRQPRPNRTSSSLASFWRS